LCLLGVFAAGTHCQDAGATIYLAQGVICYYVAPLWKDPTVLSKGIVEEQARAHVTQLAVNIAELAPPTTLIGTLLLCGVWVEFVEPGQLLVGEERELVSQPRVTLTSLSCFAGSEDRAPIDVITEDDGDFDGVVFTEGFVG